MAKKKKQQSDPKTQTLARIKRTEAYAERVRALFAATVNEILALNKTMPALNEGEMFSFDNESLKKQHEVERLLRQLHSVATMAIEKGIRLEWATANAECDKLVQSCFGKKALETPEFTAWTQRNEAAQAAFISRSERGLNLSQRVWKTCRQLRDEMEVAITVAVGDGTSAASMSRSVRKYLNDPDLMFRRFRYKAGEEIEYDEDGNEIGKKIIWGKKWKKKIRKSDGTVGWIDYDKDSYRDEWTGSGYYKSSAQNAMRVARTETNIAYRRADNERWRQMDFVLGQRVQLSRNHPKKDVCDKLAGDYPPEFVFDGWHPQCFCFVTPILMDENEIQKMNEAMLRGETYKPRGKRITQYPENFKQWVRDNEERIVAAHDIGTDPYFVRNNFGAVQDILNPKKQLTPQEIAQQRHEARTPEQEEKIRLAWQKREERIEAEKQAAEAERLRIERINNAAHNVLNVANNRFADFGIDTVALDAAIQSGDTTLINAETRALAKKLSEKQKQIKTTAQNVMGVASKYKDFDGSGAVASLADIAKTGDLSAINAQTRALASSIASIRQQLKNMSTVVPNAQQWADQFAVADIQAAHDAVQSKLASLASLPLDQQIKKLEAEIIYVADPNYLKPHTIYPTWKVSQSAYMEALAKAKHQQKVNELTGKLNLLKIYLSQHPKATALAALIQQADNAIASGALILAEDFIFEAQKKKDQREKAQARRDAKKKGAVTVESVKFDDDCFTQERRDKALWHKGNRADFDANDYFIENGRQAWGAASEEMRTSIHRYTVGSAYCTETLRSINNHTGNWWYQDTFGKHSLAETQQDIDNITKYIGNNTFSHDVWIKRDDCTWCINYIFGMDFEQILKDIKTFEAGMKDKYRKRDGGTLTFEHELMIEDVVKRYGGRRMKALVGRTGYDNSFVSCGSNKNTYFDGTRPPKDVVLNIYCPKGTMGVYAEPFNNYGQFKRGWNGKDKPTRLNENEIILQRGITYRITKVERGYCAGLYRDVWFIDVEVIAQNPQPVTVVKEGGRYHV